MPRIRMRLTAAGPAFCRHAGRIYEVSEAEAELLLAARAAERLSDADGATAVEMAATAPEENAAERTGRTRRAPRG